MPYKRQVQVIYNPVSRFSRVSKASDIGQMINIVGNNECFHDLSSFKIELTFKPAAGIEPA
jgi:hypothetical protein